MAGRLPLHNARLAGVSLLSLLYLLLRDPPHLTHMNGLLQYDCVWPYCWQLIHCMLLFLFTVGSSMCMIVFCSASK